MACFCNSARDENHARIAVAIRNSSPIVTTHDPDIVASKVESAKRAPTIHAVIPHAVSLRALSHMTSSPISSSCVPRSHKPDDRRMAFLANLSPHDARATSRPGITLSRFRCLTWGQAAIMHRPRNPANQYIFSTYTLSLGDGRVKELFTFFSSCQTANQWHAHSRRQTVCRGFRLQCETCWPAQTCG